MEEIKEIIAKHSQIKHLNVPIPTDVSSVSEASLKIAQSIEITIGKQIDELIEALQKEFIIIPRKEIEVDKGLCLNPDLDDYYNDAIQGYIDWLLNYNKE